MTSIIITTAPHEDGQRITAARDGVALAWLQVGLHARWSQWGEPMGSPDPLAGRNAIREHLLRTGSAIRPARERAPC